VGFFFLPSADSYSPADSLVTFLAAGPPPIYIGFGSIVVDDPYAMTKLIFDAIHQTGQRALVSKGWVGLGANEKVPENVFLIGDVPHDWLFKRVSCVVHHGGAGTTAAGIAQGRPTVVVPFFGDQMFWGSMVARVGAGPTPIAYRELTPTKLAAAILEALKPKALRKVAELAARMSKEQGAEAGADSIHRQLHMVRCALIPARMAVWRVARTKIKLSACAAFELCMEGLIDVKDLKLQVPSPPKCTKLTSCIADFTSESMTPTTGLGGPSLQVLLSSWVQWVVFLRVWETSLLKSSRQCGHHGLTQVTEI
jgi:hypothetical protein